MDVYDTSSQRPAPWLLKPGDGLILYCSRNPAKVPSRAECDAYRAHGNPIGFVYEDSTTRAVDGNHADGVDDATLSAAQAAANGHPKGKPIYIASDNVNPVSLDYCRGFRDGLAGYEARLYAGDRNLERVRINLGFRLGWQASAGSWSDHFYKPGQEGGHGTYPLAALWQVVGGTTIPGTDINIVNNPAWNGTPEADVPYSSWPDADKAELIADLVSALLGAGTKAPQYPDQPAIPLGVRIAEIDRHVGIDIPALLAQLITPKPPTP